MDLGELKKSASSAIDGVREELVRLAKDIHENPELAFEEYKASNWLCSFLEKEGFLVKRKVAGMDTDFLASFSVKEGGPTIAVLAEYDALPGVGHACGHNIIGTSAAGAGVGVKKALEMSGIPGRVLVLGTPAEEGGGGKVLMVKAGIFKDVDAALMMHPTSGTSRIGGRSLATHSFQFDYYGKAAHAAGSPTEGINALDAVNIFFHAVACLRQHVPEDVRMHGMVTKGGDAVNIIPDHTQVRYLVRSYSQKTLKKVCERVKDCARAGALATGCKLEIQEADGYKARVPNKVLSDLFRANLAMLGEEVMGDIVDGKGSTDFGDVSREVPACNAYIKIAPEGVAGHSVEFREASISERAEEALILSAKAMAFTALDLMADSSLLLKAKEEFLKARQD
ncbi:MAG: M20 family metallopeptidase [Candidatus Fermentithermobacillus carboniphilus]|uniref:Peptidase M20 domain-containing protein 2 n=1 Tax=Candidatus Fermentithermobacillus carboniphilus TaxID=3085328 RepID=A0AAT9LDP4_9FIRM|nr:MAG: M20 family metallopeptidase [Candidatus Fermentithermobacillus carboniphilus]